ncbi:MAG: DNA-3-methyladenine glycosylase 2 family protein [Flavobacterium sp.]|nr:MAG: DNA-3-methyladenine glycosylase 2 family protein [Flavobacterium sp.]
MQHAFDFLTSKDKILKSVIDEYGLPKIQFREQGFAAMCHIILEQQVSIASARAAYQKLAAHLGDVTPEKLLLTSDEALRGCGISRQKILYLKDMASQIENGALDFKALEHLPEADIREKLLAIKGVGNWTVEIYLMFCLQSPDVIPFGDIAIRHAMKELYSCATVEEMEVISDSWKPLRTYASYILWHQYLSKRGRTI